MYGYDYDFGSRPQARQRWREGPPAARDYGHEYRRSPAPYPRRPGRIRAPLPGAPFHPLRPDDALARALEHEAAQLVLDYLHEERYGAEYARSMGQRTPGRGGHLRDVARRIARPPYDRGWW